MFAKYEPDMDLSSENRANSFSPVYFSESTEHGHFIKPE